MGKTDCERPPVRPCALRRAGPVAGGAQPAGTDELTTLLVIDDSAAHRQEIVRALRPHAIFDDVLEAESGLRGLKLLLSEEITMVVCDLELPGFDGEKILHIKQASPAARPIPLIFITGSSDRDRKARLLDLGACDVIDKPFFDADLVARVKLHLKTKRLYDELRAKSDMMAQLSTTDAVTGLRTRRYAAEVLNIEILRAKRYGSALSILMADLDHFKQVNDEYGHLAGDAVLAGSARILLDGLRATDVAGRFGGEEFLVVLAQNDQEGAESVAERWREAVERAEFVAPDGRKIKVHLSIGTASFLGDGDDAEAMISRADRALYRAKAMGRNQVVVYDPELDG